MVLAAHRAVAMHHRSCLPGLELHRSAEAASPVHNGDIKGGFDPMYTLYWSPGTASMCVHWMLIELGEPHELVKVDIESGEHRKPEYLKLNPSGVVPTLVVDGAPLGESAALCMLLA